MAIIEITKKNVSNYSAYICEDMAENMRRRYYRGLLVVSEKGEVTAGIIWELNNLEKEEPTESHIKWFYGENEKAVSQLFKAYKEHMEMDLVSRSFFSIPANMGGMERKLLKDNGFTVRLTEGDDVMASLRELTKIPIFKKNLPMDGIEPISTMTVRSFRKTISSCVSMDKKGICEDLEYLPMNYFDEDVSCYVTDRGQIVGIMLFHVRPSGVVSISLMVTFGKDYSVKIPGMMKFFVESMQTKYSLDTLIHVSRHNQTSFLLSEKLLPRGFGIPVYAGEREE